MEAVTCLTERISQLESRIDDLAGELDQALQLIDRYTNTLGLHLKLVATDANIISNRLSSLERLVCPPA